MVERDEDSRNGKRINGTDRKQQSPPTFVNQFARYIESQESKESKVSYAEALRQGHKNGVNLRPNSAQGDSASNTDGNLSRSFSTPFFDSSAPSTLSLPHSISSPDLESQDNHTENKSTSSGHDFPNSSSSSSTTKRSNSDPSALSKSSNPLYFGKLESSLSLPKSFPYQYASTSTTSNSKPAAAAPPSRLSNSDSLKEELQRLIRRAMESGSLRRQCANCGDSQHCCGQAILEALSSILPT